jgi:ElaB/YqjD/DUF883 family membrane-anchored ribosome-binding protein
MSSKEKDRLQAAKFLDNLTSFLGDEDRTAEEIAEDLRTEGLDPQELLTQFHRILSEHAPTWKERAERERAAAIQALQPLREKASRTRDTVVSEIRRIVEALQQQGAKVAAGTYYRKLDETTDQDLESLLEDLKVQLEAVRKKAQRSDAEPT